MEILQAKIIPEIISDRNAYIDEIIKSTRHDK